MDLMNAILAAKLGGGSGGGGSAENAVLYVAQSLTDAQKSRARLNIGAASEADVDEHDAMLRDLVTYPTQVTGTAPTIQPLPNRIYKCGTLTSLTVSTPLAEGAWSIEFTSGATATTTSFPAAILGLEDFAAEATTIYEINVLDNRAVVGSWAVSA